MSSPLKTNTETIQNLINQINALPEAENLDSEISTQTTLISEQDAKIAELAEILSGKAGGSANTNIETCTVNISPISYDIYAIDYTTVNDNGNIEYKCLTPNSKEKQVLTCVCGSNISISTAASYSNSSHCQVSYNGLFNSTQGVLVERNYFICVNVIANSNEAMYITICTNSGGAAD